MDAFDVAEKNGRAEDMRKDLCALFERLNTSQREGFSLIPAAFLRVSVTVPWPVPPVDILAVAGT